ncbi:MAG: hypothetical protein AAB426_13840 [Myxococcota bacterium]
MNDTKSLTLVARHLGNFLRENGVTDLTGPGVPKPVRPLVAELAKGGKPATLERLDAELQRATVALHSADETRALDGASPWRKLFAVGMMNNQIEPVEAAAAATKVPVAKALVASVDQLWAMVEPYIQSVERKDLLETNRHKEQWAEMYQKSLVLFSERFAPMLQKADAQRSWGNVEAAMHIFAELRAAVAALDEKAYDGEMKRVIETWVLRAIGKILNPPTWHSSQRK